MIAVDSNILIYAHRKDSDWYKPAYDAIEGLTKQLGTWAITWPSVHEFLSISTHPRIYSPPSTIAQAVAQMDIWLAAPNVKLLGETLAHWVNLKELAMNGHIKGPQIHDARIAAICLQHGVTELWTADRDFSRFPKLKTRNPLVG